MLFDLTGIALEDRKAQAAVQVDTEAEAARLRWLTGGSGQAQEYRASEEQARAYQAAGYPTPFDLTAYPMIAAEMEAQADAGVMSLATQTEIDAAARGVADQIVGLAGAWMEAGRTIKRLRRAAKLQIDGATTFAEVHAALRIIWPTP